MLPTQWYESAAQVQDSPRMLLAGVQQHLLRAQQQHPANQTSAKTNTPATTLYSEIATLCSLPEQSKDDPTKVLSVKCIEHAPTIFHNLRTLHGVSESELADAFDDEAVVENLSTGRSEAVFIHSHKQQFLLKSMNLEEISKLKEILSSYHEHMIKYCKNTLLCWFLGCFTLDRSDWALPPKCFILMSNSFPVGIQMDELYDLKGSLVGRLSTEGETSRKDQDWLNVGRRIVPNVAEEGRRVFRQLVLDVNFLESCDVMDYSLIVGVENVVAAVAHAATTSKQSSKRVGRYRGSGGVRLEGETIYQMGVVYYLGIIDFLQPFNARKKLESSFKSLGKMLGGLLSNIGADSDEEEEEEEEEKKKKKEEKKEKKEEEETEKKEEEETEEKEKEKEKKKTGKPSGSSFNLKRIFGGVTQQQQPHSTISCVNPAAYGRRFKDFLAEQVFSDLCASSIGEEDDDASGDSEGDSEGQKESSVEERYA
jgi:hypothetical protein